MCSRADKVVYINGNTSDFRQSDGSLMYSHLCRLPCPRANRFLCRTAPCGRDQKGAAVSSLRNRFSYRDIYLSTATILHFHVKLLQYIYAYLIIQIHQLIANE
jgi:hypothetical protein